jgi:putative colanic acid biosynthesis acetyltransferase WcaF
MHPDPALMFVNEPFNGKEPSEEGCLDPQVDDAPVVDLRQYDQSWFDLGRPRWLVMAWWLIQAVVFPLTLHSHHAPRRGLLRLFGAQIGRGVVIRPSARFTLPWKVSIGDHSWIGDGVMFYSLDTIMVGSHTVLSQKTYLCTGSHDITDPAFGLQIAPIRIGNGVWVATDCFVGPGVTIGANTVIGARSSVFQDLPNDYICWGTPCKARRRRQVQPSHTEA